MVCGMNRLKIQVNTIGDIGLLLYLCASFSHCSGSGFDHMLTLAAFGIICGYIVIRALRGNLVFDGYCVYSTAYVLVIILSYLWAEWPSYVFSSSSNLKNDAIQFIVFSVFLSNRVRGREDIIRVFKIFILSVVYMLFSIVVRTPVSYYAIGAGEGLRIGTVTGLWVTDIAVIYGIGIAIYFFFFKQGKYRNIFALGILVLCCFYLLLTGSKQGLLLVFIFFILYTLINRDGNSLKKIGILFAIVVLLLVLYEIILSVPQLYSAFGARLEDFVNGIISGEADSSTNTRSELMLMALNMFFERPILGWGYYSVTAYTAHVGYFISTFAHSAYLETAADLGLVGLVTIYSMHALVLVRFFRNRRYWNPLDVFLCSLVIALVILDIMNVSYMWLSVYFVLQMAYLANKYRRI